MTYYLSLADQGQAVGDCTLGHNSTVPVGTVCERPDLGKTAHPSRQMRAIRQAHCAAYLMLQTTLIVTWSLDWTRICLSPVAEK